MTISMSRLTLYGAVMLGALVGWESTSHAASMYSVTDLGPSSQVAGSLEDQARALHPNLDVTLSDSDKAGLPSVEIWQGVANPILRSYQMRPWQNTDSGIVLGTVPNNGDRANPLNSLEFGYTQKSGDGTFGPFVPLTYQQPFADPQQGGVIGYASLDAKGEILVTNGQGQKLIDLTRGTTTDLTTLLPPGALSFDGLSGFIRHATIAADGTIFAEVVSAQSSVAHTMMLAPLETPEPSTLAVFGIIVVGLAATRGRSKR